MPRLPGGVRTQRAGAKKYDQLLKPPGTASSVAGQPGAAESRPDAKKSNKPGSTIGELAYLRWGVRPQPASERFETPGWWYEGTSPQFCPACSGALHAFRKKYDGPKREPGRKRGHLVAVVCPACPASYQLRDLGICSFALFMTPPKSNGNTVPAGFDLCDVPPGGVSIRTIRADQVSGYLTALLLKTGTPDGMEASPPAELRLLHWVKTTNPQARIPRQPPGTDTRVILPLDPGFESLQARLAEARIAHRRVRYWLEDETVSTVGAGGELAPLQVSTAALTGPADQTPTPSTGASAFAARDAFAMIWDAHQNLEPPTRTPVDAAALVPAEWVRYLPYPTFDPAQAERRPCSPIRSDTSSSQLRPGQARPSSACLPCSRPSSRRAARPPGWCRSAPSPTSWTGSWRPGGNSDCASSASPGSR